MSATYQLSATLDNGDVLEVIWSPTALPAYACIQSSDGNETKRVQFDSLNAVDAWAISRGVAKWRVQRATRCLPIASDLPIQFDDAPAEDRLEAAIVDLHSGFSLKEVSAKLNAHPQRVRAWLLGFRPADEVLRRMRPR